MSDTKPFDPARYMTSPEAQRELLADAVKSRDADYIVDALRIIARALGVRLTARMD